MTSTPLRIGTRGSRLALAQTGHVAAAITAATGREVELITVTTHGDVSRASLSSMGGEGVFVGALREALLRGECDLVVHSLKDLPTAAHPQLALLAIPERADARDALCARDGLTLDDLPDGATVGTGSPRRAAQLRSFRPDLEVVDLRGNVDTRLGKVSEGTFDAVVLAAAALGRLELTDITTDLLPLDAWPTAPGQGALGIEARADHDLADVAAALEHEPTRLAVLAERAVLSTLEAGCAAPLGAHAVVVDDVLELAAVVYALDGGTEIGAALSVPLGDDRLTSAREAGARLATQLLEDGAAEIAPLGVVS